MGMDADLQALLLRSQRNEITEFHIYSRLAKSIQNPNNRKVMEHLAADEQRHYQFLRRHTGKEVAPDHFRIWWFVFLARFFGLSFATRLLEKGEHGSQKNYEFVARFLPDAAAFIKDEQLHEEKIMAMIKEERLEYASAVVLGLNDALVELTGALTGLTFALQNGTVIAVIGLITGIAAACSMAASGYLSFKEESESNGNNGRNPVKSAVYTGVAYILTVLLLVLPYFVFSNVFVSLLVMLALSLLIVLSYTYYISVAKNLSFRRRFLEMAALSFSVVIISFLAGLLLKTVFNVSA